MADLPEVGLNAVIQNLPRFEQGAKAIDQAYKGIEKGAENVGKATEQMGLKFDEVSNRWRTTAGRFASSAELAAAGLENPKKKIEELGQKATESSGKVVNFSSALSKLSGGAGILGGQLVGLGNSLLKIGAIAGGAALAGVTALGAGLAAFATSGVNKAIDLDQQMANIAATMGQTKEAVAPLKQEIMDLALDPNLVVNTTQAADAIEKLAQNGLTMTQIIDGAAKSTVAMANATGADFTTAANIATGAMDAFNLKASDLEKVADGITGVLVGTKFSAEDYSGALAQAGGIMGGLGVTLEDFNTVLAASASSFSSGSDAGTSFKTFLQRLSNPTDEAKASMEKYGISLFDATGQMRPLSEVAQQLNDVFHGTVQVTEQVGGATKKEAAAAATAQKNIAGLTADIATNEKQLQLYNDQLALEIGYYGEGSPKVRSRQIQIEKLTNTINDQKGKMNEYQTAIAKVDKAQAKTVTSTIELTEAQKAELATIIGGADAARTVLALAELSGEQFEKLSGTVNDSGQAFRAAATRVDSLQGAFDIFGGIIEAIQIQVGDKFLPLLRQVTVGFTDMATQAAPLIVEFFGQIAAKIGELITQGQALFTAFQTGGTGGLVAALGLTPETNELIAKVIGSFTELGTTISSYLSPALEGLAGGGIMDRINQAIIFVNENFESFKGAILGVGAVLAAGVFAALITGIMALLTPINLIVAAAALLGVAWAGNWGNIQGITFSTWAIIQPILAQLWTWLQTNIPIALQFLSNAWTNYLLPAITTVVDFVTSTIIPTLSELWTWVQENLPVAISALSDLWNNMLLPALTGVWDFIKNSLFPLWVSIVSFFNAVAYKAIQALAGLWQNVLLPALRDVWKWLSENVIPIFASLIEKFTGEGGLSPTLKSFTEGVLPPFKSGMDAISEAIKKATDFFKSLASAVSNFELPAVLQPGSPTPFELALTGIADAAQNAGQALSGMITQDALDRILGLNRHIADNANVVEIARRKLYKFFEARNLEEGKRSLATRQMTEVFRANQAAILGAANPVEMFRQLARQAGILGEGAGFSGQAGAITQGGFAAFIQAFQNASNELQMAQQQAYIEAGRTALNIGNRLTGIIQGSAEILDNRVEALQQIVDAGLAEANFEGQIISATQAQEMLNQALEEQRQIQDDLMQMKQNEAKLDFLSKQLDLIETINDAGLNVEDILGGLVLGMDASIPDLIAATNNLITAMIDQVNADLQLASPSKVMAEKGRLTGQGFIEGILGQVPNIAGAIQSAIAGPVVNAPVAVAGAAGGTVVHNYYTGGNNINNGMDAATFEANVLNVIRRNLR